MEVIIMTKKIVLVLGLFALVSGLVFAQEEKPLPKASPQNAIFVEVSPLIVAVITKGFGIGVGYEHALGDRFSLLGHADYLTLEDNTTWGFDVDAHLRYYTGKKALSGLFLDGGIGYGLLCTDVLVYSKNTDTSSYDSLYGHFVSADLELGWKFTSKTGLGFFFEPYIGYLFGLYSSEFKDRYGDEHTIVSSHSGSGVTFGFSIGWTF
jgi:hypothetical protein